MRPAPLPPEQSPNWVESKGEPFRCRTCQAKQAMVSAPFQVKAGHWIQIKCPKCKTMNYIVGVGD